MSLILLILCCILLLILFLTGCGAKETEKLALGYFEGDVIWHRVFGEGVISSIKGDRAEVKFYKYRCPKSIDLRYCIVNRLIRSV